MIAYLGYRIATADPYVLLGAGIVLGLAVACFSMAAGATLGRLRRG